MIRKLLLTAGIALAAGAAQAQVGPSPVTARVDRNAMKAGQPAQVCLDITSSQCTPIGNMVGGAFQASIGQGSVLGALGYTPPNKAGDTITGPYLFDQTLGLPSIASLNLAYAGTPNPSAMMFGTGNRVSFCPALSCIHTPGDSSTDTPSFWDHQRTSALISAATQDDGHSEEQTLAVTTTIGTGKVTPYAANKTFAVGDNTAVGNAVYRAIQAGTTGANSAPPGGRPTAAQGGSYTVTDGTVKWQWINDSAINAKVGFYNETNVVNGAGAAWGAAFNYHFTATPQAGMFLPGVEFDYANDSGTPCALGTTDCTAIRVASVGSQVTEGLQVTGNGTSKPIANAVAVGDTTLTLQDTNGVAVGYLVVGVGIPGNASITAINGNVVTLSAPANDAVAAGTYLTFGKNYSTIWALRVNSDMVASQSAIEVDASAPIGLGFGSSGIGGASHAVATIQDSSRSPASLAIGGKHSLAAIYDNSTSQNGISLNGIYAGSQATGSGWNIAPNGQINSTGTSLAGFASTGTHTGADFIANSASPYAIQILGQRSVAQILGTGWNVDPNGRVTGSSFASGGKFGVSCAAGTVSLSTLEITNGIVTHC